MTDKQSREGYELLSSNGNSCPSCEALVAGHDNRSVGPARKQKNPQQG